MLKKNFTTSNFLFCFCVILYSFFVLNFYLPEFFGQNIWQNLEGVLYRYQTLLTGSIAIFSVSLISQQLRHQLRQHSDNAKLALKPEIDALVVAYSATVEPKMPAVLMALMKKEAKEIAPIFQQQVDFVRRNSSPEVANRMDYLRVSIDQHRRIAELINSGENSEDLIEKLEQEEDFIDWGRHKLEEAIENRHRYLKTFCPDLEIVFPRDEAAYR